MPDFHRVLMLSKSSSFGGVERVLLHLAEGLTTRGWKCTFGVMHDSAFVNTLRTAGFEVMHLARLSLCVPGYRRSFETFPPAALARSLRRLRPSVVHAHGWEVGVPARLAGWVTGIPVVTTIHGLTFQFYPRRKAALYRWLDTFTSLVGSANIAVSNTLARRLAAQGYPRRKLFVVPNGVPVPPEGKVSAAAKERVRVGAVGRLSGEKGHDIFLEAAKKLLDMSSVPVEFVLIGDGPRRTQLAELAAELGIASSVVFRGFCADMDAEYRNLDVLVFPSVDFEGLGMVLLEAMSFGVPVVGADVGAVAEVITADTGYIVRPGDPNDIAAALLALVHDRDLRSRMGRAGRARVIENYCVDKMVERYERIYLWLSGGRKLCA